MKYNTNARHVGHYSGGCPSPDSIPPVAPDLGLSTSSLVRRARASSQSVDDLAKALGLHGGTYTDRQVREFNPAPSAEPTPPAPTPGPAPSPDPAPAPSP